MKPWKKHAEHKSSLTDKWLYIRAKFYMLNTMSACSRVCGCVCYWPINLDWACQTVARLQWKQNVKMLTRVKSRIGPHQKKDTTTMSRKHLDIRIRASNSP